MFKFKQKHNIYFRWGLTAFLTVLAIFAAYDTILGAHRLLGYIRALGVIITPVAMGGAIAYLLAPISDFLERTILHRWATKGIVERKPRGWVRVVSILMTFALVLGAIALMLCFLLPDMWKSTMKLIENIPMYVSVVSGWFNSMSGSVTIPDEVYTWFDSYYDQIMGSLTGLTDSSSLSSLIAKVSGGVVGVFNFFANLIVGLIIAAYMIGMKERLSAQCKKIICSLFEAPDVAHILEAFRYTDRVFGGFIRGNILDSIIVGLICFIAFQFMSIPYSPLLSVLIGVTNLIPFFGPFMGAIPSCILIFLDSPIKCLEFIIFILVLQQLDGNILAPKILGQSTGLASLWVIISVLVGGAFFGPIGMLLGCPAFALIYALIRILVNHGLDKKDLPTATDAYRPVGVPESAAPPEDTPQ